MSQVKIFLDESDIPRHWYNVVADMPNPPAPPLGPDGKPIGPDALATIFPGAIIEQEVSQERWIPIPEPVRDIYRLWRPTPLYRALRLEEALGTPARIYYKYEGVSPAGSHKPNTAVAQAYFNHLAGVRRLTTETGAGQWGSALAMAGQMFGIEVRVYMVRVSYEQKPFRRSMMETWGAEVQVQVMKPGQEEEYWISSLSPWALLESRYQRRLKRRRLVSTPTTRSVRFSITSCFTRP